MYKKLLLLFFMLGILCFSGCTNTAIGIIDGQSFDNVTIQVEPKLNESDLYQVLNNPNFELAVNMGLIEGFSFLDKFGENPDVDTGSIPETVWEGSTDYIYDDWGTAPIVSLISDDSGDTGINISIRGLDINGNLITQVLELNGNNRVALTTPLWRVFRMQASAPSGTTVGGTIYCYVGTGGVPTIANTRAIIDNGNHQTLMAVYTVPKGYVGYLYRGEVGGSRSQNAGAIQAAYFSRRWQNIFNVKKRVDTTNQGSSYYQDVRSAPDIIPALTDIKIQVEDVSANNMGVFATFDILLVNESRLSEDYLISIGQPGYD